MQPGLTQILSAKWTMQTLARFVSRVLGFTLSCPTTTGHFSSDSLCDFLFSSIFCSLADLQEFMSAASLVGEFNLNEF